MRLLINLSKVVSRTWFARRQKSSCQTQDFLFSGRTAADADDFDLDLDLCAALMGATATSPILSAPCSSGVSGEETLSRAIDGKENEFTCGEGG